MLTKDGGKVFPIPLKAPAVVISIHIKSCDNPRILRYTTPYFILSFSGINTLKIGSAKKINKNVAKIPTKETKKKAEK
jgi:hypothetical protein